MTVETYVSSKINQDDTHKMYVRIDKNVFCFVVVAR